MKKIWVVFVVLVAAFAASAGAGAVTSGAVLDQYSYDIQGTQTISPATSFGQTFTVGRTGYLTDVSLRFDRVSSSTNLPVRVAVFPVDGSGSPDSSGGELAAQNVSSSAVPTGGAVTVDVAFTTPAYLKAGKQYALVVSSDDTTGYDFEGGGSSVYTGGFVYFAASRRGPWTSAGGLGVDAWFETYMAASIPTPALQAHVGYCAQAPVLRADGTVGVFVNLVEYQQLTDPAYRGATPAFYGQGYGLTCDDLPAAGYVDSGYRVDSLGVHNGNDSDLYEYFTK